MAEPDKSSAMVFPSQQLRDDMAGVSYTPGTVSVNNEPAACKLSNLLLLLSILNTLLFTCYTCKLICYKHFLQQKALFVGGLTISGWMIMFC
jgi:hypothetical protein